jgi:hypothetical protein
MTFDLRESMERAERRLGFSARRRRPRRDRGQSRLPKQVAAELDRLLQGHDRPPVRAILSDLEAFCRIHGFEVPARGTIYAAMARSPSGAYLAVALPPAVRETLYNVDPEGQVPGHQLVFHCLNYGGLQAMSFAAGLPWLALYQAGRMPGWRPGSRGLLDAILRARGISGQ